MRFSSTNRPTPLLVLQTGNILHSFARRRTVWKINEDSVSIALHADVRFERGQFAYRWNYVDEIALQFFQTKFIQISNEKFSLLFKSMR